MNITTDKNKDIITWSELIKGADSEAKRYLLAKYTSAVSVRINTSNVLLGIKKGDEDKGLIIANEIARFSSCGECPDSNLCILNHNLNLCKSINRELIKGML
jgi:hypothetical protein